MTLSSFRAAPRRGHLERTKRIFGYLFKMKHTIIRIRTDEYNISGLPSFEFDWKKTIYGKIAELIPEDAPKPLGKFVTLIHFIDANMMHCILLGRSVTGILTVINNTPI